MLLLLLAMFRLNSASLLKPSTLELSTLSGLFRGNWSSHEADDSLGATNGSAFLVLQASPGHVGGVDDVRSRLVVWTSGQSVQLDGDGVLIRANTSNAAELRVLYTSHLLSNVSLVEAQRGGEAYWAAVDAAAHEPSLFPRLWSPAEATEEQPSGLKRRCSFKLTAQLSALSSPSDWDSLPSLVVKGVLDSADCDLRLELSVRLFRTSLMLQKAGNAALFASFLAIALLSLGARQLQASTFAAQLAQISFASALWLTVVDMDVCLLNLTVALGSDELWPPFFFAALTWFVLASLVDLRLVVSCWKAAQPAGLGALETQRAARQLHIRVYGAMLLSCGLCALPLAHPAALAPALLLAHSPWFAQIWRSATVDAARPLQSRFVLLGTALRLALPLYYLGCPRNWLKIPMRPALAAVLVAWSGLQVAVLAAQWKWGARWMVPRSMCPPKYDYCRAVGDAERGGGAQEAHECVVCQTELPAEHDGVVATGRWVTPCGHYFHEACLRPWLAIRLDCPTCRAPLPLP
jgi:hypothetical protein